MQEKILLPEVNIDSKGKFINEYYKLIKQINKRGIFPKFKQINITLKALRDCDFNEFNEEDKKLVYQLLLIAKTYYARVIIRDIPFKYKEDICELSYYLKTIIAAKLEGQTIYERKRIK